MNECMFHIQNRTDLVVPCIVVNSKEELNSRCAQPQNGRFTKPVLARELIVSVWEKC